MKQPPTVLKLKKSSHSCFYYETMNQIVTVYSKEKKTLRLCEINAALDLAKAKIVDRMRGEE